MIKFGYTIAYVDNVNDELTFFERVFGIERRFVTPDGDYGELATGATVLAFANHVLGEMNLPEGYVKGNQDRPVGVEIAMVTDDVNTVHLKALEHGARELRGPVDKPWGQTVSYVVSPSGVLLEICSLLKPG
ncbi:MAG: VOC family protein [Rhodobacteraceae bacterium]|nr:VOC family protein [Paracoccaceae bacterium]MCY4197405.1 VOC family protein [Paracoccaceae bacterium]MCY4328412.1 VOC family protein [Paracoccaceae bacterium]